MSVIVTMLLYVFGLDVATGKLNYNCQNVEQNKTVVVASQPQFPVKVFNPNYNINPYPVNYNIPTAAEVNNYNNIAPVNQSKPPAVQATIFAPNYSSSPEYSS
jgi:hypothetical protein